MKHKTKLSKYGLLRMYPGEIYGLFGKQEERANEHTK